MDHMYFKRLIFGLLVLGSVLVLTQGKADNARLQKIKPWDVQLIDNGYHFLVGISEDIPVEKGERLLANLRTALTRASEALYEITRRRSAFANITIVIPSSWDTLPYPKAKGETVDKGNIYVYSDKLESEPFTLKYFKGSQSDRGSRSVMLHDDYMIKNGNDREIGQKIIEQWMSLRFGLEMDFTSFTNDIDQTNDCVDGETNSVCEGLQKDIKEWDSKKQRPNAEPNFIIVRQRVKRIVVVLDVSGSMSFRMTKARQGIIRYFEHLYDLTLDDELKGNTLVGAVKFSTNALVLGNLSAVTTDEFDLLGSRISLLDAEQKTSIGAGLYGALAILKNNEDGAEIILISDGVEDTPPFMNETWDRILQSKVVVHTIGFSNNADSRVDALGAATGGLTFIHNDGDSGNDLEQAFLSISDYENSDPAATGVVVYSSRLGRSQSEAWNNFSVDALLSKNLTFDFECTLQNCISALIVSFESPDDKTLKIMMGSKSITSDFKKSEYEADLDQSRIAAAISIKFLNAKPGIWRVRTQRVYELGMTATAYPNNPGQYPILAFCFWGIDRVVPNQKQGTQTMNALISRGNNPVTGANVTGIVEFGGKTANFTLKDDGEGGDLFANDGIYTARFLKKNFNFTRDERYNLKVKVGGNQATKVRTRQLVAVSPARSRGVVALADDSEPANDLERIALGGTFMSIQTKVENKPDPIVDLKATVLNHRDGIVLLTWTAPYDPFYNPSKNFGNRYEVRYAYTLDGINFNARYFDSGPFKVRNGSLRADEEGEIQKLEFYAAYAGYGTTMYFAIKSVRPAENWLNDVKSDISNIARVTFVRCNPNCSLGGKCVEGISSCRCDPGYGGSACETYIGT